VVKAPLPLALVALTLTACGTAHPARPRSSTLLLRTGPAPALAALPDGGLLVGTRDGRITALHGDALSHPYPRVAVSRGGQRGLLSLVARGHAVFAAWTDAGRRLVVGRLRRGAAPLVRWRGPRTATLANGGHLAVDPEGRLVVGVGDRQRRPGSGVLLGLDPAGPSGQRPVVLSRGWNNPFAFAYAGRELWVADNAPGRAPERLARGDLGTPRNITALPRGTAPSGLVALGPRTLLVCGFVSGTLDRYARDGRRFRRTGTLARDCRYGAVRLTDGRIAFAADDAIRVVDA
jgi:hypothetical protein